MRLPAKHIDHPEVAEAHDLTPPLTPIHMACGVHFPKPFVRDDKQPRERRKISGVGGSTRIQSAAPTLSKTQGMAVGPVAHLKLRDKSRLALAEGAQREIIAALICNIFKFLKSVLPHRRPTIWCQLIPRMSTPRQAVLPTSQEVKPPKPHCPMPSATVLDGSQFSTVTTFAKLARISPGMALFFASIYR